VSKYALISLNFRVKSPLINLVKPPRIPSEYKQACNLAAEECPVEAIAIEE
jgi:hypothetical protein